MINLRPYVDQEITVRLQDGTTETGTLNDSDSSSSYAYEFNGRTYTRYGFYWSSEETDDRNIVAIVKPFNVNDASLKELKARKAELQQELVALETAIKQKGIPAGFAPESVARFLTHRKRSDLLQAFEWDSTPQGSHYWDAIGDGDKELTTEDIRYLTDNITKYFLEGGN